MAEPRGPWHVDDPLPVPMAAADHWRRYRRLMVLMVVLAAGTIGVALMLLHRDGVILHPHFVIALGLGIGVSLLLAGALMGLVFVSAASGHDQAAHDESEKVLAAEQRRRRR